MTLKLLSKLVLVTMVFYLGVTKIYAQQSTAEPCGFDQVHKEKLLSDPVYRQRAEQFEKEFQKFKVSQKTTSTNYVIPIVVHVMQDGTALTDISEQQIQDAINELNERYRKIPGGLGDGNGVDVTVEFSLAVRTPDNQCTNGIVYYNLSNNSTYVNNGVNRNNSNGIDDAVLKAYSVWDQTKYYNIWLVNQIDANGGGSGTQGYAYFSSAHGSAIDGALILANKFVTSGNTTAAHEIGHALNLYHTFEGDNGGGSCPTNNDCSTDGDLVCDTPPHKRSSSDCVVGTNSCDNNTSTELFIHNYMDYSQDVCQSEFTDGQKTRMLAALNIDRASFLASNGNMSLVPVETPTLEFTTTASYVCLNSSLYFTDRSSCVPNSFVNSNSIAGISHSWSVTNGSVTLTSTDQNPTFQFTATGTYDATLTLTTSFGTQTLTKKGFVVVGNAPTSSCSPSTSNAGNFWQTISNVTLSGINNSSSQYVNDGYSDYTCSASTILEASQTYSISVSGNAYQGDEIIEAYIDYNNNGTFESGEIISSGTITNGGNGTVTNSFTVPANATTDTPLRMRVIGEATAISANERSCTSPYFVGDVEDYTIFISSKIASVTITATPSNSITYGDNVTFTATPTNGGSNPTYIWYINGVAVSGQTNATFSSTTLVDGDIVTCQLVSDLTDAIGSPATSNEIQMTVVGAPISDFTYEISKICVGESVTFTDASQLTPTSWSWNITGAANQNSSSQNPTITFNTAGTYTVSLTASNAYGSGTTKTYTDVITVYATPGAQCTNFSRSGQTGFGIGITKVLLESINHSSQADDVVYEDNVCTENTILEPNTQYNLSIKVGTANAQWVYAYIDYNNNNSFTDNGELIYSSNSVTGTINTTFTTPAAPNLNELLRMRVITDFEVATSPSPCRTTLGYGQVEDYGVIISQACSNSTADAGGDQNLCSSGTLALAATATNGTVAWTTNGTGTFNDATLEDPIYTPSAGDISNGSVTLTMSVTNTDGCSDASDNINVTITGLPAANAGSDDAICSGNTFTNTATASNGSITWSTSGTGSFTDATIEDAIYTPSAADITNGSVTLTMTVSSNGCSDASDAVNLTINNASTADAGNDATICSGNTHTLSATSSNGTVAWSTSGTGTFNDATLEDPIYTPSANDITNGSVTLTMTLTNANGCSDASDAMTLTITGQPTADAGNDSAICSGSTFTNASTATNGSVSWETSGDGSFNNSTIEDAIYTPSASDIANGSVTLTMTVSSNGCSDASDAVNLTINNASTADAGNDATICSGNTHTLSATSSNGTVAWSTSGTGTFNDATLEDPIYTPSANDITNGSVTLTMTITNANGCSDDSDAMTLTITDQPTADAGNDSAICSGSTFTNASTATNGTVSWTTSGDGSFNNSTIEDAVYTPGTSDIANGSVNLTMTVTNSCSAVNDVVVLTINPTSTANAGSDATICSTDTYTLSGSATSGTVAWTTSGDGNFDDATITNATYTPSSNDISSGIVTLTITVTNNSGCSNTSDAMTLTIDSTPTSNAGVNASFCSNETYTLNGTATNGNINWSTNGSGTFSNSTIENPIYTPSASDINNGSVTLLMSVSNNGCSTDSDNVTLSINEAPDVKLSVFDEVCIDDEPFTLTGGIPVGGEYSVNSTVITIFNPAAYGAGTHQIKYNYVASNGCSASKTQTIVVGCLGIDEVSKNSLIIYPNPSNGNFKILNENNDVIQYSIFDASGKVVMKAQLDVSNEINLTHFSNGVYTLELSTKDQVSQHKIVIKH